MSYALSLGLGEDDQYAAGQYGVGSQSYYGRDSYTMAPPAASSSTPAPSASGGGGGGGDDSAAASAPAPSGGASPYSTDASADGGSSGMTLLVGLGVVTALGYYLFFRGGR